MQEADGTQIRDVLRKLEEIDGRVVIVDKKVDEVRVSLFGVEGNGGLYKWVRDINESVSSLKTDYHLTKGKVYGIAIGVSGLVSIISAVVNWIMMK